jgi:hypothetical protein
MHQRDNDKIKLARSGQNDRNIATEEVPNKIPNDCNRETELVQKEIEYDHGSYWKAYQMGLREIRQDY